MGLKTIRKILPYEFFFCPANTLSLSSTQVKIISSWFFFLFWSEEKKRKAQVEIFRNFFSSTRHFLQNRVQKRVFMFLFSWGKKYTQRKKRLSCAKPSGKIFFQENVFFPGWEKGKLHVRNQANWKYFRRFFNFL